MTKLTNTDRLSLAVAEAIVAYHLGIENFSMLVQWVDFNNSIRDNHRQVSLMTRAHADYPAQIFVMEVCHTPDAEFEHPACLFDRNGGVLRRFWWDIKGFNIELMENSER